MVRPVVQLAILLLAIPAQYFITLWGSNSTDDISIKVRKLMITLQEFGKKWLVPKTWLEELKNLWFYLTDDRGESIATEVFKYRSTVGYFANSPEPRYQRPVYVRYRVGQVFLHKSSGYHGIIIGWDNQARAPDSWLEEQYGSNAVAKSLEPHYAVLPDKSENFQSQTYISQDDIEIVTKRKVDNTLEVVTTQLFQITTCVYIPQECASIEKPSIWQDPPWDVSTDEGPHREFIENDLINDYFEAFDGTVYQPRPFLKQLYPKD